MNKEFGRFLVTGIGAVLTDFIVYQLLCFIISVDIAKSLGFIAGSILAYIVNKLWTFEQTEKSHSELIRFIVLYTSTFVINVLVNRMSLNFLQSEYSTELAFIVATGTSTVLNFIGMKFFVFTKKTLSKEIL